MFIFWLVLGAVAIFFIAGALLDWKPVEDWRSRIWREASSWLQGSGLLSLGTYLVLWNQMPLAVQRLVPDKLFLGVSLVLFALALLAKYTDQPASRARIAELKAAALKEQGGPAAEEPAGD